MSERDEGKPSQLFIDLSCAVRDVAAFAFFTSTVFYYIVMLRRKVFHMNLQTILLLSPSSFILILLPNIAKDMIQWFILLSDKQSATIMMVVDIGQFSAGYNLLVLVTERAIATLFVAKYENMCAKMPWFGAGLAGVQWTASAILLYLNYNGEHVSSIALVISIVVGCALSATIFALLPKISERSYNRQMRQSYGTVDRYQASENMKSAKVLQRLVLSTVASVMLMLAIYSYIRFFVAKNMKDASFNLHFAVVAVCATFLNFVVLVSHDRLRKELIKVTHTGRWFGRKKADEIIMVTSVSGNRLDVPKENQTDAYYGYYQTTWNV